MFGFIGIFVLLLCSALVSGSLVFSLSQKDIDETIQGKCSKGKLSDL
jgi:hypothetical protein